ncbi:hypothetical protein BFAG_04075 [Bacteroides fragilis 3_1_12]|uniref:Transmembrane protein n=1 Tax=Bacteroides fragilis 3_1_12 TaxID=457424 RepID=A0ABN0BR01_BACFG|nr:hypothetical protein BFAG_04075 [Bacteroides fragilis 3_1_12]
MFSDEKRTFFLGKAFNSGEESGFFFYNKVLEASFFNIILNVRLLSGFLVNSKWGRLIIFLIVFHCIWWLCDF